MTNPPIDAKKKSTGFARKGWMAGGLLLVFVLTLFWRGRGSEAVNNGQLFEVNRGPLTISVTESGTIQSRERVIVKSEVEGRLAILWLIPEGQQVQKGDLLIELDASGLEESKVEQQIRSMNAEAAFIRAREQLEITKNQSLADVSKATLDLRFADLAQIKYIEGEYPQELQKAEAEITLAREELQRAEDKLGWSKRLADEGYLTRMEWQADELAARRAQIDIELAEGKLALLKDYTHKQKIEELVSNVEQMKMTLDRVKRRAAADIVQAEADLVAKKSEHERQQLRLDKLLEQLEKCRIIAPADGMVVYVTTGAGRRSNEEPLREGQEVRERQDLIYLPTATSMMAEVRIHESSLRKIKSGQRARVTVDALPERVFSGHVERIAILPDAQNSWLNPDLKVYQTEIYLDGNATELRPGMNCRAEIIIDEYDEAIYVPLQSVLRIDGESVVYVPGPNGPEPRRVDAGLDNNRMVHILGGLEEGDQVVLTPPLRESRRSEGAGLSRKPRESAVATP